MKLKDASFLIRIYSFLMSNNKVRSPLTDMINICMTLYEILLINLDLLALILSNLSIQYKNFHWANTTKPSPIQIFSVLARLRYVQ
jgi:hypothetical protein